MPPPTKAPLTLVHNIPYVPVYLNDQGPFQFIYDTGAYDANISLNIAEDMQLKWNEREFTTLDSFAVAGIECKDLFIGLRDNTTLTQRGKTRVDGFLGLGFLRKFVNTIDYQEHTLLLESPADHAKRLATQRTSQRTPPGKLSEIPITDAEIYTYIPVHINGKGPFQFMLDTGAGICLLSTSVGEHLKLQQEEKGTSRGARPQDDKPCYFSCVSSLSAGTAHCQNQRVMVTDLSKTAREPKHRIDGLLGYPFLSNFLVTINFPKKVLTLAPYAD